ncbi:uncharacterized protein G2W53_007289 [Senna tora]|uniref:Uncharacterized protein n=1 Tax=Senna tora TaxID=362788 RepID=A0A834X5X8_9FABA|nr:uncharacterized protein G2W53_007289 [Senna tora]
MVFYTSIDPSPFSASQCLLSLLKSFVLGDGVLPCRQVVFEDEGSASSIIDQDIVVPPFNPREDTSGSNPFGEKEIPYGKATAYPYNSSGGCTNSKFHVAESKLCGVVALQQFWNRVMAGYPQGNGYEIIVTIMEMIGVKPPLTSFEMLKGLPCILEDFLFPDELLAVKLMAEQSEEVKELHHGFL